MIIVINMWEDNETDSIKIESESQKQTEEEKKIIHQNYFDSLLRKQPELQIIPIHS